MVDISRLNPLAPTVVVATHNAHKLVEIIEALDLPEHDFVSLDQLGIYQAAVETANDFCGNAWIKASHAFARSKLTCLADDSGLEVEALSGAPGVISARYAGEKATDSQNVEKLLAALDGRPQAERRARFVCEIAYIDADGSQLAARGVCEGYIATSPRGSAGFGYDPVFIPDDPGDGRSMAELSAPEKNQVSHRGQALRQLRSKLLAEKVPESSITAVPSAEQELSIREQKIPLAVYDFDGTLLDGASPVRLVRQLLIRRILPFRVGFKVGCWALRYKLRLPVQQEQVRRYIFSGLSALPADQVSQMLVGLYHQELRPLLRQQGLSDLQQTRQSGSRIAIVSASFRPIIAELAKDLQADFFICTDMEISGGFYTGQVAVAPPDGIEKLLQLREKADSLYGEGNWLLDKAYGDYISDEQLLSAALHPFAVDPDLRLAALASELGWPVLNWQ